MTKYREILRLRSLGFSERNIATSCGVSRNTVAKVTKRADELQLKWPLDFDMTDSVLDNIMFPNKLSISSSNSFLRLDVIFCRLICLYILP